MARSQPLLPADLPFEAQRAPLNARTTSGTAASTTTPPPAVQAHERLAQEVLAQERLAQEVLAQDHPQAGDYAISALTRMAQGERWRTEAMRSHRTPSLLWFTRGQGRITMSGITRGFGPHNLLFLPPRTMYGFEVTGAIYGSLVHFPDTDRLSLPREPLHLRFRDVGQQTEITSLIDQLSREIDAGHPDRATALFHISGLIGVWLNRQTAGMPDAGLTPDASRKLAAAFTALVEEEFTSGANLTHYAAELGVSTTHLSRACNLACGRPASSLLADRILFEARRLLIDSNLQIKDIASTLGYRSAAYFTRAFQSHTGQSPSAFRKSHPPRQTH
ncbi:HTH-type transcriptional activator Btr [Aquimixticola soesokkakensis]|uniref:HTH-type transcriptional activator Btr n=1 Tax=Aquimixticola soesokkakensis TaxID=1519096 RepID=A0A1Y5SGB6_9RHOB|nr:helix-turn-helix domain-containing protein [Aquimixticola soesokkakensis]SLN39790.1 HTH-type transcriptional activator Btr [Aquimixticola soesokkakensis]